MREQDVCGTARTEAATRDLRTLEAMENALWDNAKIVIPADAELVNVIGELAGILPLQRKRKDASGV
jgi:hypothetical protein